MNDAQINALMAAPITAREVVGIAHVLIDAETAAASEPDANRGLHLGAIKGITAM